VTRLNAIGIDLGTTYSSVAIVSESGEPEIIPNSESERLTPSVVFFDEDAIVVGQTAKDAAGAHPDHVVMFVKRQMGNSAWHVTYHSQQFSPIDVSAIILKKLKQDAEQHLGRALPNVVITVPAYFDDVRRRATISAGEIAGFKVLDLINEPTAAAIAFGSEKAQGDQTILVCDLGGGTFDVTVMRIEGKVFRIVASDGDHQLGGKDFDDALMRFGSETFQREHGFDPTADSVDAWELRAYAERVKRELSKRTKTTLMVRGKGRTTRVELTRDQFSALIQPKLETMLACVRSALRDAALTPAHINRVLLIGGSTRIPAVRSILGEYFGQEPDASVNPDEAVALGAAIVAAQKDVQQAPAPVTPAIAEKVGGLQITDVTSHSLGIEAYVPGTTQKLNSILIRRNSPIPAEVAKEFVTSLPGQTAIKVTIYQGEFPDPALCNPVGEFTLSGLPPNRPAGCKVRVTVSCGSNGVVNVTALDIQSGQSTTTSVSYRAGESKEQVSARQRWLAASPVV
jgi:molecular chaperone DnaK